MLTVAVVPAVDRVGLMVLDVTEEMAAPIIIAVLLRFAQVFRQ